MRAVIQRVSKASVSIDGKVKSKIKSGWVVLLGIEPDDTSEDQEWLAGKIIRLRIFNDENGVMNSSVMDVDGNVIPIRDPDGPYGGQFRFSIGDESGIVNITTYENGSGAPCGDLVDEQVVIP